ncbi:hypothetical protein Tco_1040732, partial [Tanacetum coccineum]
LVMRKKVNSRYVVENVLIGCGGAYIWNEGNKKYNTYKEGTLCKRMDKEGVGENIDLEGYGLEGLGRISIDNDAGDFICKRVELESRKNLTNDKTVVRWIDDEFVEEVERSWDDGNKDMVWIEEDAKKDGLAERKGTKWQLKTIVILAKTHDPLALVANTYASSSSSQSPQAYYVTHHPLVIGNDDHYQGEVLCDDQEDSLTTEMMLLARAITQRYSTPTNNHLRTSSNTRNQPIVQANRVDIQSKNVEWSVCEKDY